MISDFLWHIKKNNKKVDFSCSTSRFLCKFAEKSRHMINVTLSTNKKRRLTFYLALEEYVARHLAPADYFFQWQVEPTVIFGRNQLIENEVNMDYCRKHNINTFRRKSGGGCVYADMDNIMFSYVTPDDNVRLTFSRYVDMVVATLRKLGIDAQASGRNDVMIGGRKVSGNAFYHIPGRSIVHGTMLYGTNMENMVGSITPTDEKLLTKGVQSVRQHITTLREYIDMPIEEFKQFVTDSLCDSSVRLTEAEERKVEEIEEEYLTPEFIYGNNPKYNLRRHSRIDGVGEFWVQIEMKNDTIKDVNIVGDFFLVGDMDNRLIAPMRNVRLNAGELAQALPDRLDDIILNLRKDDFVKLITNDL